MSKAEEIIKSVAEKTKRREEENVSATVQLVVFDLDNEEYAVEIKDLQEIIKMPEITPIPGTPEFIRGIFNLRGKIVVVLDLEKRFNLIRQLEKKIGNIIIAEVDNNSFGIIVDEVTEIINVPVASIQQTPTLTTSKIQTDYLKGVVIIAQTAKIEKDNNQSENENSRLIILLDLPKMLQEKELMSISQMTAQP